MMLERVTHPDGTITQYLYEDPGRPWLVTGVIDENGHRSHTVSYDSHGRAVMSERAESVERVKVSYNDDGTTTLTNALGKRTTFHFETIHGVKKIVHVEGEPTATCQGTAMDYAFDENGFLVEEIDAEGVSTTYQRDQRGLILSRTEAVGLAEQRTTTTQWHSEFRKPLIETEGHLETRYEYDAQGRMLSRTKQDLNTGQIRRTGYSYTPQGRLASVSGPRTDVDDTTHYAYDEQARLASTTNALGHTSHILERDPHGRPSRTRDANGLETTLHYDLRGRLIEQQVGSERTTMNYDAVGNLIQVNTPSGAHLNYHYDSANRVIGLSDSDGNAIHYTLDAMGNRTQERVYDPSGQLVRTQQQVYDELSRLLKNIGAEGQTTHYGYDRNNNRTSTFDPHQQLHAQQFDALNRLLRQTNPLGGHTDYRYDEHDRLTRVTDPNGNTTEYHYDALANLLSQHSPDTGTTTYRHDEAGNVIEQTDAKGQTSHYRYDALNRQVWARYADGREVHYHYDSALNGIGRLARISEASGSTAWHYDLHGRPTERIQHIALDDGHTTELTTRYHYDSAGQLSRLTYPSGLQVDYHYQHGKIRQLSLNGQPLLDDIAYQPFGPIRGWRWGNGLASERGYDLDGRLIHHTLGSEQRRLHYDPLDNLIAMQDSQTDAHFDYDALSRLTAANDDSYHLQWQYDPNGNRLQEVDLVDGRHEAYTIDTTSNRLLAVAGQTHQHDPNGNLIHDGKHSYGFDARNRLTTVNDGDTARYRYNALGQRVYKWALLPNQANPDLTGDGQVTEADLHLLQEYIRSDTTPTHADLNGDGKVDNKDIACIATLIGDSKNQGNGSEQRGKGRQGTEPQQTQGGPHSCLPAAVPQQRLFVYDEWQMLGEYHTDGSVRQETIWLGSLPVATVQNGNVYHMHTDHLGTPRVITDQSNREVWRWDSDPFGMTAANDDPEGDGSSITFNLRFPGQYFDAETGLHYNYFRDYDPATGRYVESDPIGLGGGLNSYIYALGNPLRWYDSNGLQPSCNGWWEYMGFNPQLPRVLRLCNCYWLCRDCKYPVVWSGNKESLPSTTGMLYFDANVRGSGAGDIEAGNACLCRNKPGPETGCKDGDCGQ